MYDGRKTKRENAHCTEMIYIKNCKDTSFIPRVLGALTFSNAA
jgi:hypothetical protein